MTTYDTTYRNTRVAQDVTVMSCVPAPVSGTAGTAVDVIGVFESAEINLKRLYVDTTGAADIAATSRATAWDKGSVKLTGFSRGTASKLANIFANSDHVIFQLAESSTGDAWQLMCTTEDYSKSVGKDATKDTLTLGQEGVPYYAPSGGTLAAMSLSS